MKNLRNLSLLSLFIVCCFIHTSSAQTYASAEEISAENTTALTKNEAVKAAAVLDRQALFNHPQLSINKYVATHLAYPSLAIEYAVEGNVIVKVSLDEQGKLTNATVVKGIGMGCDQEALRMVNGMPSWLPAYKDGRPVPSEQLLEIRFSIR